MEEETRHGADGHGQVVGQAVVAQAFAASGGGHDVDDDGVAAHRHHAERHAVNDAEEDEERQGARHHVAAKHGGEEEVGQQVEGLAGKGVQQVAGEGADAEGGNGVAGEHHADGGLVGSELFQQIEGQDRHQLPEAEEQQEVGGNDAAVAWSHQTLLGAQLIRFHHAMSNIMLQKRRNP